MNRTKPELIHNRLKKIKQRVDLLKNLYGFGQHPYEDAPLLDEGKYTNNNYVNKGGYIKTNVRKAHSNYRRPGGFGADKNWSPHDQRQIDDMNSQENEYGRDEVV